MLRNLTSLNILQLLLSILLIVGIRKTFYYSSKDPYKYSDAGQYLDVSAQNTVAIITFGAISVTCIIGIIWIEIHKSDKKK